MDKTETLAREIAAEWGYDWNDCGMSEKQGYLNEARLLVQAK